MNKLPKAKYENIVIQQADKELLLYDLSLNKVLCLNDTSAIVYQACDGQTSFEQLKDQHQLPDDLIYLTLDELKKAELIETQYLSPFEGLSRREVLRRVGLATMISLPFITSITAPKAANAASSGACVADSDDCIDLGNSTQSNCCSGLRCLGGAGFCLACRTSSSLPYVQENSLTACQNSLTRNLCCNPSAPVTFVPANPPFSTVGSCFCG